MNPGGLGLLLLIGLLALVARRALGPGGTGLVAFQRRALLVLAVALPGAGLLVPLLPWTWAAAGIVLLLGLGVEGLLRGFERHETVHDPGRRG